MRTHRGLILLFVASAVVASAGAAPAWAEESHPGGLPDTCPEVLNGSPTGDLEKTTDPPDGSEVQRGDAVTVTLRWDADSFDGPVVHKVLDCVTVGGHLASELSGQERDTANDGSFEWRFTVPTSVPVGAKICDRGFVSGPGTDDDFERQKSNDVCFTVAPPDSSDSSDSSDNTSRSPAAPPQAVEAPRPVTSTDVPTPSVPTPTASPTPDAATPPLSGTPQTTPAAPAPDVPAPIVKRSPEADQSVPPTVEGTPLEAPGAPKVPKAMLANTGANPKALVFAGMVLCAGGLSIIASAGRRRRLVTVPVRQ